MSAGRWAYKYSSRVATLSLLSALCIPPLWPEPLIKPQQAPPTTPNEDRILGIIPNYQTVNDPSKPYQPLTPKQKWGLFVRESLDPFNLANAAVGAGFSQVGNKTPQYGVGAGAYSMRYGAALADLSTQNFFSAGVLACALHQDPRYFRKGPQSGILSRVSYSVSRIAVAKNDSGKSVFNAAGVGGMILGIAASNLYYPSPSVHGSVMANRLTTSLTGGLFGNLTSEFWPDLEVFLKRHHLLRK